MTIKKEPGSEARPMNDGHGLGAEDVNQNPTTAHLLLQALNIRPKLNRAALDVYVAIIELGVTVYQEDIMSHTGMSESSVRRGLRHLETTNLLKTIQHRNPQQGRSRTKNSYRVTGQKRPVTPNSDRSKLTGHPPINRVTGQKRPPHDVMHDEEMTKKLNLLNFIDWGERLKRCGQKHCNLDYAQSWRDWWDRKDFGNLTRPGGFANSEMRKGHPPPQQMNLPADRLDLPPDYYTAETLEYLKTDHPLAQEGWTFNPETGSWS